MLEFKFENKADRDRFSRSLLISLMVLAVGLFWTYRVGLRANQIDHALYHAGEHLEMISKVGALPQQSARGGVER